MGTSLLLNTDDSSYSFMASTDAVNGGYKVVLSTLHPVLADGGFDICGEKFEVIYISDLRLKGEIVDLANVSDVDLWKILRVIDNKVHSFYFAFYPKVMGLSLSDGYRLVPTRLGSPKPAGRSYARRYGTTV